MKILSVFGTRPEAIKMSPVVRALSENPRFESKVCVTAQHREMLDQVLNIFGITPDFDLDVMKPNQSLADLTGRVLTGMTEVFNAWQPDMILVHGDTTTTMASSLAAYYRQISIGHVEAGLRTGDKYAPWPEEMNRHITGVLADIHFAPTQNSRENLLREGIDEHKIHVTGNTVIDALLTVRQRLDADERLRLEAEAVFPFLENGKKIILITAHRRENFGEGFDNICNALASIARRPDVQLVYPVHLNPNVQDPVHRFLSGFDNIHLITPLDYASFVYLMNASSLIVTDSGGIQEEAPALGKPVLVMRDCTERPEAVAAGTARIIGTEQENIIAEISRLLDDKEAYFNMANAANPYGVGDSGKRIADILERL